MRFLSAGERWGEGLAAVNVSLQLHVARPQQVCDSSTVYKLSTFHLTAWSPGNYGGMVFLKTKGSDSLSCGSSDPFEVRPKEKRTIYLWLKKNYR